MARTRMAEPGFFLNERLAALPPHARLLYLGLWQLADRVGLLEDRPRRIQKEVFPYEQIEVDDLLWMLASREGLGPKDDPFIIRYEVDGLQLISIPRFLNHQKPHIREAKSILPPPGKGKIRTQQGPPKASPGHALGTPKADPGTGGGFSEGRSAQGEPLANLGSAKASPRRPVSVLDPESVTDPDPDPRKREADEEVPRDQQQLLEYVIRTWPEIPTPGRAVNTWLRAYPGVDLLAVANEARAYQVSHSEKRYQVPAALLNRFFTNAKAARRSENGHDRDLDPMSVEATEQMLAKLRRPKNPMPEHMRTKK